MRVGITGGAGFIGGYVVQALKDADHQPMVFDHHGRAPEGTDVFLGDVRDATAVTELAAHVDGIIHLAAVLGTQETIANPRPAAETNVGGSLNVFEAASQYGIPVVYAAVGNAWMASKGAGAYVISKTCAEHFAGMFNKNRDGQIRVVRPMNAYGPRQAASKPFGWSPVRKIMPALICRALSGLPIEVYGDGTQVSDCVYVEDVARTFVHALGLDETPERPIECGPVTSCTVNDVARMVVETCVSLGYKPVDIVHLPMRPGEVPNAVVAADVSTMTEVGIDPYSFVGLEDGIARTVDWFQRTEGQGWDRPVAV